MSKKKFTDGLESLFGDSGQGAQENDQLSVVVGANVPARKAKGSTATAAKKTTRKRTSSKNFTSDLDSLFEEALQESIEDKVQKIVKTKAPKAPTRRRRREALTGLDALIRRTVESGLDASRSTKKRVTFVFDHRKLEKLRKIAKEEKSYLKDIISDVVSSFIESYEKNHGTA